MNCWIEAFREKWLDVVRSTSRMDQFFFFFVPKPAVLSAKSYLQHILWGPPESLSAGVDEPCLVSYSINNMNNLTCQLHSFSLLWLTHQNPASYFQENHLEQLEVVAVYIVSSVSLKVGEGWKQTASQKCRRPKLMIKQRTSDLYILVVKKVKALLYLWSKPAFLENILMHPTTVV